MYGIFVKTKYKESLVWKSLSKDEFWLGGSNITPMIFPSHQSTRSAIKKIKEDFSKNPKSIVYNKEIIVKKVDIINSPKE